MPSESASCGGMSETDSTDALRVIVRLSPASPPFRASRSTPWSPWMTAWPWTSTNVSANASTSAFANAVVTPKNSGLADVAVSTALRSSRDVFASMFTVAARRVARVPMVIERCAWSSAEPMCTPRCEAPIVLFESAPAPTAIVYVSDEARPVVPESTRSSRLLPALIEEPPPICTSTSFRRFA